MYGWWRFQRYRICLKNLEIRISIEKIIFFYYIWRDQLKKLKLENKPKTPEEIIVGRALSIVACVWNVRNKPRTR